MRFMLTVRIDVPALDRLVDYLTAKQQTEIDALAARVAQLTQALKQSSTHLEASVENQK
jgi:uncharacterized coiled-coil protein SlyX